jgi:hypothetical protein
MCIFWDVRVEVNVCACVYKDELLCICISICELLVYMFYN